MKCTLFFHLITQLLVVCMCFVVNDTATNSLPILNVNGFDGSFSLDSLQGAGIEINPKSERWKGENCLRQCKSDTQPQICYFHFILEHYQVMGP